MAWPDNVSCPHLEQKLDPDIHQSVSPALSLTKYGTGTTPDGGGNCLRGGCKERLRKGSMNYLRNHSVYCLDRLLMTSCASLVQVIGLMDN